MSAPIITPSSQDHSGNQGEAESLSPDPWAIVADDYPSALVRVAALRADGVQHLIFGWIELYPFDMTAPDGWIAGQKPWSVPGQPRYSCTFSATKVPVRRALNWYADASRGRINIAVSNPEPVLARPLDFAPEPNPGRFNVNVDAPFVFRWHDGPRINRLVPMAGPHRALFRLSRSEKAREWLALHLGFDPFFYDEWLSGLALVAPNPICASFHVFRSARAADGKETLTLQALPRRIEGKTADVTRLTAHVIERRGEGWSNLATASLVANGLAKLTFPQPTGAIGHALMCSDRGLLQLMEPAPWLDQIHMNLSLGYAVMDVEVPAGGRRKPANRYQITQRSADQTSIVGEAVDHRGAGRARTLLSRRRSRQRVLAAEQKVFGIVPGLKKPSPAEAEAKKKEAHDFVVELVSKARRRLLFVDSFFGWREMRAFALRNEHNEVTPRILMGLQALKKLEGEHPGFQHQQGAVLMADLEKLSAQLGPRAPVVRVMPGGEQSIVHDRYLIVDDEVWHCGPSFNELGERLGVMVRLPDGASVLRLVRRVWARSQSLEAYSQTAMP